MATSQEKIEAQRRFIADESVYAEFRKSFAVQAAAEKILIPFATALSFTMAAYGLVTHNSVQQRIDAVNSIIDDVPPALTDLGERLARPGPPDSKLAFLQATLRHATRDVLAKTVDLNRVALAFPKEGNTVLLAEDAATLFYRRVDPLLLSAATYQRLDTWKQHHQTLQTATNITTGGLALALGGLAIGAAVSRERRIQIALAHNDFK